MRDSNVTPHLHAVALVLLLLTLLGGEELHATPSGQATQELALTAVALSTLTEEERVTFRVEGMTCSGCAIAARMALNRLDGVQEADVSFRDATAVVTYDPEKVTVEQMIEAIAGAGFAAEPVEGDPVR